MDKLEFEAGVINFDINRVMGMASGPGGVEVRARGLTYVLANVDGKWDWRELEVGETFLFDIKEEDAKEIIVRTLTRYMIDGKGTFWDLETESFKEYEFIAISKYPINVVFLGQTTPTEKGE